MLGSEQIACIPEINITDASSLFTDLDDIFDKVDPDDVPEKIIEFYQLCMNDMSNFTVELIDQAEFLDFLFFILQNYRPKDIIIPVLDIIDELSFGSKDYEAVLIDKGFHLLFGEILNRNNDKDTLELIGNILCNLTSTNVQDEITIPIFEMFFQSAIEWAGSQIEEIAINGFKFCLNAFVRMMFNQETIDYLSSICISYIDPNKSAQTVYYALFILQQFYLRKLCKADPILLFNKLTTYLTDSPDNKDSQANETPILDILAVLITNEDYKDLILPLMENFDFDMIFEIMNGSDASAASASMFLMKLAEYPSFISILIRAGYLDNACELFQGDFSFVNSIFQLSIIKNMLFIADAHDKLIIFKHVLFVAIFDRIHEYVDIFVASFLQSIIIGYDNIPQAPKAEILAFFNDNGIIDKIERFAYESETDELSNHAMLLLEKLGIEIK